MYPNRSGLSNISLALAVSVSLAVSGCATKFSKRPVVDVAKQSVPSSSQLAAVKKLEPVVISKTRDAGTLRTPGDNVVKISPWVVSDKAPNLLVRTITKTPVDAKKADKNLADEISESFMPNILGRGDTLVQEARERGARNNSSVARASDVKQAKKIDIAALTKAEIKTPGKTEKLGHAKERDSAVADAVKSDIEARFRWSPPASKATSYPAIDPVAVAANMEKLRAASPTNQATRAAATVASPAFSTSPVVSISPVSTQSADSATGRNIRGSSSFALALYSALAILFVLLGSFFGYRLHLVLSENRKVAKSPQRRR